MSTTETRATPTTTSPEVVRQSSTRSSAWPSTWIDSWFDHLPLFGRPPGSMLSRLGEVELVRVEHFRDGSDLVIRAEMPGIDNEDDIDVSVVGDKLTVSAKREQRTETKENGSFRSEFHYGSFSRTVTVPPGTSPDDVKASYVDGIVEVRVPVGAGNPDERRKVKVTRS